MDIGLDMLPLPGAALGSHIVRGVGASLRQVDIAAGSQADRHSHDHEQFVIVLRGEGDLECEAGSVSLRPGVVIRLPAGAWHSARFISETTLLEVNVANA